MHDEDDERVIAEIDRDMEAVMRLAGERDTWQAYIERCIDILREAERIRGDPALMEDVRKAIDRKVDELTKLRHMAGL